MSAGRCRSTISKHVRAAFGVTINDVFVACCAGAVRRMLAERSFDSDSEPLVASIPLSRRPPDKMDGLGNYTAVDYVWLRSDIADPVERLQKCHEATSTMKDHFRDSEGGDLSSILAVLPPPAMQLLNKVIGAQGGKSGLMGNMVLSNVPGPPNTLYFGRSRVAQLVLDGPAF